MVGPNTTRKNFWNDEETRKLLIGYNRYYDHNNVYKLIQTDPEFEFESVRSNVDIKDRIRTIFRNLKSFKGFFVPRNCTEPRLFVPEELWSYLDSEDSVTRVEELPEGNQVVPMNHILYKYTTDTKTFNHIYNRLPTEFHTDPLLHSKTWDLICNKCFTRDYQLDKDKRLQLLEQLTSNRYLISKKIGVRIFVCKYEH